MSGDVYTALCTQAEARGLTLSNLVAHCLATTSKPAPPTLETEPQEDAGAETATGLDRLVNLERWVQLFLSFFIELVHGRLQRSDLLCPACGERDLDCVALDPGSDGLPPVIRFACPHCQWEVTDHATYAAACGEQSGEMDDPSPAGQTPAPSAS